MCDCCCYYCWCYWTYCVCTCLLLNCRKLCVVLWSIVGMECPWIKLNIAVVDPAGLTVSVPACCWIIWTFGSLAPHRCAIAATGLRMSVPASRWIIGKGLRPSYGEDCLFRFTFCCCCCHVSRVVVLYYFCCCCCNILYVIDVRSEPYAALTFSQIFQHFLECSLECSLMPPMQRSVCGLISISLLFMEGPVRRLVQSWIANWCTSTSSIT